MGQRKGNPTPTTQQQAYINVYGSNAVRTNLGTKPVMIDDAETLNDVVDVSFATDVVLASVSSSIDSYIATKASTASVTAISSSIETTLATKASTASVTAISSSLSARLTITGSCANDAAAQSAGVPVGGLYHTSGTVKVRLV